MYLLIAGVILILVLIAIPDFFRPAATAPQAEAKTNLGALYTSQVAYFGEYGTYAGGPECFEMLGWEPEGATRYTYWCGRDRIVPTAPDVEARECVNVKAMTSRDGFIMCAAGNIDEEDKVIDTWSTSDSHKPRNDLNDVDLD